MHLYVRFIQVVVLGLFLLPQITFAQRLPVEAFASLPDVRSFKLSPSGEKLIFLESFAVDDLDGVAVRLFDIEKGKLSYLVTTDNTKFKVNWIAWAGDDHVLVSAVFPAFRWGTPTTETRLMVKSLVDGELRNVLSRSFYKGLSWVPQFQDDVIDFLPDEPNSILLSVPRKDPRASHVFKIDVATRKRKSYSSPKTNVTNWYTDQQNRVRAGIYWEDTEYRIYTKSIDKKAKWKELTRFESFSESQIWPMGFGLDPNILYFRAYHDDRLAIFKTDLSTEEFDRELVFSDENYDVDGGLIYSEKTGEVIGTTYSEGGGFTFWDPTYKALQAGIDKALPDTNNYIVDFSGDESKYILFATSDTDAGSYYLGDRAKKSLMFLGRRFRELPIESMVEKEYFEYEARDGLVISAYLSQPKKRSEKPLPTIIFPHGGPISYDDGGFDYWTQFFVNRGYAVLQMNFRGSSGYGYDFMKAGLQNWGQAMQDDVEDGTRTLIEKGISDPDKICIAGASYGGYAALMGTVKTPDLYQCAISFAGVTDVAYLVSKSRRFTSYEIVKEQIGSKRSLLKEVSPVNHVDKIQVPVLLVHGDQDRSVRIEHGRKMERRLRKAGKDVTYLEIEDADHYLSKQEHRIAAFKAMDEFLAKHLPVSDGVSQ